MKTMDNISETIMGASREQKIDFINKNLTVKGKKITKTRLRQASDETINEACQRYEELFEKYIKNSSKKQVKFLAEVKDADENNYTFEGKAESREEFEKSINEDGYTAVRIVAAKGHHICKYCKGIAEGSHTDLLCEECRELFGHTLYSEL